jgi:hypothetical protein
VKEADETSQIHIKAGSELDNHLFVRVANDRRFAALIILADSLTTADKSTIGNRKSKIG